MRRSCLAALIVLGGLVHAAPAHAAALTLQSTLQNDNVLRVSIGIVDVVDLFSFDFAVTYNPTATLQDVLEGTLLPNTLAQNFPVPDPNASPDDPVPATFFFSFADPSASSTQRIVGTLFPAQPGATGAGELAVLLLTGVSPANLALAFTLTGDNLGFLDSNGAFLDVTAPPDVAPIPEPSTLTLMGLGLAALARGLRRKSRQTDTPISDR